MGATVDSLLALTAFLVVTALAAATGGMFQPGSWYLTLKKPGWTPPGWVFPVIWTALYVLIAIAGWKAWQAQGFGVLAALWGLQMALNAAWSWIMFGRKKIALALADAGALWLSVAAFTVLAWPASQTASALFMPYLAWVSVAFVLNLRLLQLNPRV